MVGGEVVAVGLKDEKTLANREDGDFVIWLKRRRDGWGELEEREGVLRGQKAEGGGMEGESLMVVGGVNRMREVRDMLSCSIPCDY